MRNKLTQIDGITLTLFGILVAILLYMLNLYDYLLFHGVVEVFSIVVAFGIFMFAWHSRFFIGTHYLMFLGISFFFVGSFDIVHTLAYKGMGVFIGYGANLPTQLWIASRYLHSISFLIAPFFIHRKFKAELIFGAYLTISLILLITIFMGTFPDCYLETTGLTPFKKVSEYIISTIFLASIFMLAKHKQEFDSTVFWKIVGSIVIIIISELMFTLYGSVYGFYNMIGHFLKVISFYLIYQAIIVTGLEEPYSVILRKHNQVAKKLRRERDKIQKYLDTAGVIFLVLDSDGKMLRVNRKATEILDVGEEEIIGLNWFQNFIPEENREELKRHFQTLFERNIEGDIAYHENTILTRSGEERYIAWHDNLLQEEDSWVMLASGEDITERKQMEDQIKHQNKFLISVIESLDHPFYVVDAETYIVEMANSAALKRGISEDKKCYEVTHNQNHPCHGEENPCPMEIVKQTQKPVVMEHTHYNGGTKNFEIHCYPVLSAEKKVKQVIEYTLDITTRKRAEEELRKLSRAVEQSPSTIAITDTNGNFEYVNPKFTELTGYTLEEIKGENPRILKSGYQPEELYKKMWKVISAGNEWRGEFCNKKKNGEIYWEYASISPVRNSSGDITHYLKVSEDITDRKKAEKALQESEEKFRMLFTSEKDAIALIDMDTGKILEVNPAWLELYGYTKAEALELTIADISAEPQKTKAAMEKVRREGSIQISERWHKNKNGKTFPVEISAGTFVWKGRKVTSSIARDITERKETEEKLKKAQEIAEAGNRAKSEFLANMSHEIRTPLNAILGKAETLEEQIYGPLTERQLRALHIIEESGRHLLDLINDILDVSKIEAGKLELYIEEISVRSICQISLRMIKQMAHKKNITVHEDIDSSHERIQADERRLKQILVNLLSNAVKFTPEGGDVGLKFHVKEEDNLAIFEIWDKGIGISEEDARKLFEPFVQLDNRLSREQVGTGLGLSLVFRLTELHNGSVSLKSHVGKGSTFIICIPWKQPDRVKQENSDTQFIEIQKQVVLPPNWKIEPSEYQILLVEDNKSNIATIKDYLAEKGYHISVAENGIQAVEMAREIRPDLIIMDIQLPKMDGLEATTLLKQSEKCKDIPIIALSALTMDGDKEKALNVGVDEYIVKPVSLKNLNGKVIKTLTKKKIESIES